MEEIKEIWKPVVGYEGLYEISSFGRVRSLDRVDCKNNRRKGIVLVPNKRKGEYRSVSLSKDGKSKSHSVHILVAQSFIPNPNNLPMVNHKDEDPSNNRVENLEWCNAKYNANYGTINERRGKSLGYGKDNPFSKEILQFNKNGEFIKKWDATMDIERELKINHSNVSKCCEGTPHFHTAGGFKWGYADDYERIPFKVFDIEMYRKRVA